MKRIAALTMVRNDERFLRKWVEYYSACLGAENLYVFLDGLDQPVPGFCSGVNCRAVDHNSCSVHEGDRLRAAFLSARAAELFASGYDMVLGTDVDEFLVVDPSLGVPLAEFLSSIYEKGCRRPSISGLGVDVGQNLSLEVSVNWDRPLLCQRSFAKLSTRYSKATVLTRPGEWGSGFHRVRKGNFHIVKNLYLFHFGCVDLDMLKAKMGSSALVSEGWSRHLKKRAKTVRHVTYNRARSWSFVRLARVLQNIFRPPYAWNKPAMFEARIVVRIPERFSKIV